MIYFVLGFVIMITCGILASDSSSSNELIFGLVGLGFMITGAAHVVAAAILQASENRLAAQRAQQSSS